MNIFFISVYLLRTENNKYNFSNTSVILNNVLKTSRIHEDIEESIFHENRSSRFTVNANKPKN